MLPCSTSWVLPDCSASILPLQPNHIPPVSSSAACRATARPPALSTPGRATRLETTTSRLIKRLPSCGVLPGSGQSHRRIDEADMRIGLREVAPGLAATELQVLREQAERIAPCQDPFEQRPRFLVPANRGQRVDVPEGADREACLGRAEVVRCDVAEQCIASAQALAD